MPCEAHTDGYNALVLHNDCRLAALGHPTQSGAGGAAVFPLTAAHTGVSLTSTSSPSKASASFFRSSKGDCSHGRQAKGSKGATHHKLGENGKRQSLSEDLQFQEFNGATGKNVVFAPEDLPYIPSQIIFIAWAFGVDNIISFNNGENKVSQEYEGRVNLNTTTAALELKNLRLNDSGSYKLTVITTSQTSTGQTSLKVYGESESLIENLSSANIICEGSGDITSVEWMKDKNPLKPSNRIIFSFDNRSVLISPVIRSDSGEYQCTLRNPASSETANLRLIINYGPEYVFINGSNEVDSGRPVSLSCSATSLPSASFTWRFNGSDTGVTTNTFTIDKSDITHSGDYICTAYNDVTEKNVSQSHLLVVKEGGGGGGGGLTTGAIVGIVIGVLVAIAGICGLIIYFIKQRQCGR
ncbi:cell adhesion molecule CEACAM6-like [Paramisgurnus dabryanus]|uniref:cell adhesion molecule CEACAM6-like n=1 Tax=Paramisgurnus dabryanus TaxID=90735 RepID=UPI003CCF57A0